MIEETFAYGLVIGCSLFGILWGLVNALLVSLALSSRSVPAIKHEFLTAMFRSRELTWKIRATLGVSTEMMSRNRSLMKNIPTNLAKIPAHY